MRTIVNFYEYNASIDIRNYAKCSRLRVQEMISLSETNPWLHQHFEDDHHAV